MFNLISIVLLCALIPSHEAHIPSVGNATDLQALISFKTAISDDPLGALSSWNETNTTLHFCNWFGVTCGAPRRRERVTTLSLGSFKLKEYGMGGPITTQEDVYSYGVLLLETFTGMRPTDGMFHSELNLHKYVEMAYPGRVLDVIDPSIVLNVEEANDLRERMLEPMISIFKVGLLCSKESTNERMEMGDVIKELLQVKMIIDRGDMMGQYSLIATKLNSQYPY